MTPTEKPRHRCPLSLGRLSLGVVVGLAFVYTAGAQSFDCEKATRRSEKMICSSSDLALLDSKLAAEYAIARSRVASAASVRQSQRAWVARRDACAVAECLNTIYVEQIAKLQAINVDSLGQKVSDLSICDEIRKLFIGKKFSKYSVPFQSSVEANLIYRFKFGNSKRWGRLKALCGNSSDAECEMELVVDGKRKVEFALPADIRVIQIEKKVYIVNGIAIERSGQLVIKNYTVHELLPDGIKIICDKF